MASQDWTEKQKCLIDWVKIHTEYDELPEGSETELVEISEHFRSDGTVDGEVTFRFHIARPPG